MLKMKHEAGGLQIGLHRKTGVALVFIITTMCFKTTGFSQRTNISISAVKPGHLGVFPLSVRQKVI